MQSPNTPVALPPAPHFLTLITLAIWGVVSLNAFLPALGIMAKDFGVTYATMSVSVWGYMYVTALVLLIAGPVSDYIGRRATILICLGFFIVGTLIILISSGFWGFTLGRFMQTTAVAGFTLSQTIVRDTSADRNSAAKKIAYVSMAMAIGPMIVPTIGGLFSDYLGWRSIFWMYLAHSLVLLALVIWGVKETNHQRKSSLSERLQGYRTLLGMPKYWGLLLCQAFSIAFFFVFIVGFPGLGVEAYGMSATAIGLYLGLMPIGYIFANYMVSKYAQSAGLMRMLFFGRLCAIGSILPGFCLALMGVTNPVLLFGAMIFGGAANGFTMAPSSAEAASINPKLTGAALGLISASGLLAGAIGSNLAVWLMALAPRAETLYLLLFLCAFISALGMLLVLVSRTPDAGLPKTVSGPSR